jgi:hypothetical protein
MEIELLYFEVGPTLWAACRLYPSADAADQSLAVRQIQAGLADAA